MHSMNNQGCFDSCKWGYQLLETVLKVSLKESNMQNICFAETLMYYEEFSIVANVLLLDKD